MAISDGLQVTGQVNGHAHASAEIHVLVIGAGVTGLLVAHGLKKAGIKFSIYEAEPSHAHYRPREWSMGVHWSLPMLEKLLPDDLSARLKEAQSDPSLEPQEHDVVPIINGLTGEPIKLLPVPRTIRVSRRKMRSFCTQGLDVQYGKELSDILYGTDGNGVTAVFKDGEKVFGTIIVGCDGPRSSVRTLLLGEEAAKVTPLDVVHSNVAVCYQDAEKSKFVREIHHSHGMVTHPDCFSFIAVQNVPDPDKPEDWTFQIVTSWLGERDTSLDNAGRLAQVKEKASNLPEPFRSANQWIPEGTRITYDRIAYWVPIPWDNRDGRATLCGDAAHAMTPHRGQGLNHAINDATNVVAAIKKVSDQEAKLKDVISAYDKEVVQRGADEVVASRESCYMMLDWSKIMKAPLMTRSLERGKADDEA